MGFTRWNPWKSNPQSMRPATLYQRWRGVRLTTKGLPSTTRIPANSSSARSYQVKVTDAIKPRDYQNITPTMKIPPQADAVHKIIQLPFRVMEGFDTAEKMAIAFGFHKRQSSYYRAASEELGLVEMNRA